MRMGARCPRMPASHGSPRGCCNAACVAIRHRVGSVPAVSLWRPRTTSAGVQKTLVLAMFLRTPLGRVAMGSSGLDRNALVLAVAAVLVAGMGQVRAQQAQETPNVAPACEEQEKTTMAGSTGNAQEREEARQ